MRTCRAIVYGDLIFSVSACSINTIGSTRSVRSSKSLNVATEKSIGYSMDFDEDSVASVASAKPSPKHRITMPSLPTISAAENSTDSSAASESSHQRSPLSLKPLPSSSSGALERSTRSATSSLDKSHQSMSQSIGYSMDDFDEESMGGAAGASMSAMSTYSQTFEADYSTHFDDESTTDPAHQQVQKHV